MARCYALQVVANFNDLEHTNTNRRTRAAGWFIVSLGVGAAILPLVRTSHAASTISALLILAGFAEVAAGFLRHQTRKLAILAGLITAAAGLVFFTDAAAAQFLPSVIIIMGWLLLRSMVLALAFALEGGSIRLWTGLAAATDFVLSMSLAVGLSVSTLVVSLFGATPELIASFAWLLAISFVVNGVLLLEVAHCALQEDV